MVASFRFPFGERARDVADSTVLSEPDIGLGVEQGTLRAGPYVLERRLGSGGESEVWLASHTADRTPAVIKVQRAEVYPERMRRETAILYALQEARTPHVVRLLPRDADGVVTHEPGVMRNANGVEVFYCAIELLPCSSPENLTRHLPLRRRDVVAVCDALRAALRVMHLDFDLIHNDLKPSNIVAWRTPGSSQLQVRLYDFGQSALLMPHLLAEHPCVAPEPSLRYVYLYGSFPYMPPERWRGREPGDGSAAWLAAAIVDDRTDQWSFAATVFEFLTGRRLIAGQTEAQFRDAILSGAYLATIDQARLPGDAKSVLRRALAINPAVRYQRGASVSGLDFFCRDLETALA
jgi:serine/threonine-protein kinase